MKRPFPLPHPIPAIRPVAAGGPLYADQRVGIQFPKHANLVHSDDAERVLIVADIQGESPEPVRFTDFDFPIFNSITGVASYPRNLQGRRMI